MQIAASHLHDSDGHHVRQPRVQKIVPARTVTGALYFRFVCCTPLELCAEML